MEKQPQYGQPQYGQPQYGQPQYNEKQYGQPQYGQPQYGQQSAPPPYNPNNVQYVAATSENPNAPLLAQSGANVVVVQKSSSSRCCGISTALCLFICVSCFCCIAILGGVFGAWAVRCSAVSLYRTETHQTLFSGSSEKTVEIQVSGDITLSPVALATYSVSTSTEISAPDQTSADNVHIEFTGSSTEFNLHIPWDFWSCPREKVTGSMLDFVSQGGVQLDLKSSGGDITVGNFPITNWNSLDLTTYNGKISVGTLVVQGPVDIYTSNGPITVTGLTADTLNLVSSNGDLDISALAGHDMKVSTSNGKIEASIIGLSLLSSSTGNCELEVYTSNGKIELDSLQFPNNTTCRVSIRSSNDDVTVTTQRFTGDYDVRTSNGKVTVSGSSCSGNHCSGTVPGSISHYLEIRTSNGDITFTMN